MTSNQYMPGGSGEPDRAFFGKLKLYFPCTGNRRAKNRKKTPSKSTLAATSV
jgi:hypothetical protein